MSMIFTSDWNKPKLTIIPSDDDLDILRKNIDGSLKSGNQQKALGIHPKNIAYAKKNNALRLDGALFLQLFNEGNVKRAIYASSKQFSSDSNVDTLITQMLSVNTPITIDQGTHQAEDVDSGGFMLHFDVRDPSNKCFHFYVGQNSSGSLKIIEISYMDAGIKKSVLPV